MSDDLQVEEQADGNPTGYAATSSEEERQRAYTAYIKECVEREKQDMERQIREGTATAEDFRDVYWNDDNVEVIHASEIGAYDAF
jgi:hypothetical protein